MGCAFGLFRVSDGFIVFGEIEIIRLFKLPITKEPFKLGDKSVDSEQECVYTSLVEFLKDMEEEYEEYYEEEY